MTATIETELPREGPELVASIQSGEIFRGPERPDLRNPDTILGSVATKLEGDPDMNKEISNLQTSPAS